MKKKVAEFGKKSLSLLLAVSLAGCSLAGGNNLETGYSRDVMEEGVQAAVIDQWDIIAPHLELESAAREAGLGTSIAPEDVIAGLRKEENGLEYLAFSYSAAVTGNVDEVLEQARQLLPAEVYNELLTDADEVRKDFARIIDEGSRELKEEYKEDFMRDMQQLVARSIVLLTAAVVYAFMPKFMIFGKISAAAAVSVAAGAVAVTVMAIWRYYKFGGDTMETFEQWLKDVASEPKVSYALATSVISMATSMELSPVNTGIILGVFAIYQAVDMLRTMIEVYEL